MDTLIGRPAYQNAALGFLEAFHFVTHPPCDLDNWQKMEFLNLWNEGAWPELQEMYPEFDQDTECQKTVREFELVDDEDSQLFLEAFNQALSMALEDVDDSGILFLRLWSEQNWTVLEDEFGEFNLKLNEQLLLRGAMSETMAELSDIVFGNSIER